MGLGVLARVAPKQGPTLGELGQTAAKRRRCASARATVGSLSTLDRRASRSSYRCSLEYPRAAPSGFCANSTPVFDEYSLSCSGTKVLIRGHFDSLTSLHAKATPRLDGPIEIVFETLVANRRLYRRQHEPLVFFGKLGRNARDGTNTSGWDRGIRTPITGTKNPGSDYWTIFQCRCRAIERTARDDTNAPFGDTFAA